MSTDRLDSYFRDPAGLLEFAEKSIERRRFRLARRLIHQSLIDFPDSAPEALPLFSLLHETEDNLRIKAHPLTGEPFDFVIVPTLRSGSTFLDTLVNLHPELLSVPLAELDEALMVKAPGRLLQRYGHFLARQKGRPKVGLIFHRFLLAPEHIAYSAESAAAVANTTRFVQIVREPLGAFLSELNHEILVNYFGDYTFQNVGFPWPARSPLPPGLPPRPDVEPLFDFLSRNRIFYSSVGREFSRHFSKWDVLTLEDLGPKSEFKGFAELEKLCGAKKGVDPVLFNTAPNDWTKRLMEKNWFPVTIENITLSLGIGYAYETVLTPAAGAIELCRQSPESAKISGSRPLCLAVRAHDWERLPEKIRTQVIQERSFAKLFETEFLPAWEANCIKWHEAAAEITVKELSPDRRRKFLERAARELAEFATAKPHIAKRWEIIREL